MTEISAIQLLVSILLIIAFIFVFGIIQSNWYYKSVIAEEAEPEAAKIAVPVMKVEEKEIPLPGEVYVRPEHAIVFMEAQAIEKATEEEYEMAMVASR